MKKVALLALLVLGTGAFANAKPIVVKATTAKEISIRKHKKAAVKAKTVGTPKQQSAPAKK